VGAYLLEAHRGWRGANANPRVRHWRT